MALAAQGTEVKFTVNCPHSQVPRLLLLNLYTNEHNTTFLLDFFLYNDAPMLRSFFASEDDVQVTLTSFEKQTRPLT